MIISICLNGASRADTLNLSNRAAFGLSDASEVTGVEKALVFKSLSQGILDKAGHLKWFGFGHYYKMKFEHGTELCIRGGSMGEITNWDLAYNFYMEANDSDFSVSLSVKSDPT